MIKQRVSRQLGLISANPTLADINQIKGIAGDEITANEIKVIVFYPTLVTLLGFEYSKAMVARCINDRMPYKMSVRVIKQNMDEYTKRSFSNVQTKERELILDAVSSIFDRADTNIDTLWNTTERVITKAHPELNDGMRIVAINAVISLLFLRMAVKVSMYCSFAMAERTNKEYRSLVDTFMVNVINATVNMIHDLQIPCTPAMNRSVKAVAKKVAAELNNRIKKAEL